MNILRYCYLLVLCGFLAACVTKPEFTRILASNEQVELVALTENDTFESLAQEYFGDEKFASVIARYNPPIETIDYVAIPKTNLNPSAVFSDKFQVVPILCYHQFTREASSNNRMVVTEKEFRQQMRYLKENGFEVISLVEFTQFINGQLELPEKSVVITIDDGYKSFQDIALPILKRYDFPSTVFVYPDFVGARVALGWQDLLVLDTDPLVDIQSHSKSHDSLSPRFFEESKTAYIQRLEVEVVEAQSILEERLNKEIQHFAYPYGDTGQALVNYLRDKQYGIGVTVQRGSNPAFSAPFLINRTMIFGGDSLSKFSSALVTEVTIE